MALSPQQRAQLLQAKLRTLIIEQWNVDASILVSKPFSAGAGFVATTTGVGWVLVAEATIEVDPMDVHAPGPGLPSGWLGGAVVWRERQGLHTLNVLCDRPSPADARRNELLASPLPLFTISARTISPMESAAFVPVPEPSATVMANRSVITASGADAVVEHGVLRAEVLGLEVARVATSEYNDGPHLQVGVGRHDRLAQAMMYGNALDVSIGLREAVEAVRTHRKGGAGAHPANQLSRERWMRDLLCAKPAAVACTALVAVSSTEEPGLKAMSPACAVGIDANGNDVIIGCSVGIDLHACLIIADTALASGRSYARRVLVVPEGDDLPAIRLLAGSLREPIEVVTVPKDWPAEL
jgi:hypothetical protein